MILDALEESCLRRSSEFFLVSQEELLSCAVRPSVWGLVCVGSGLLYLIENHIRECACLLSLRALSALHALHVSDLY